MSKTVFDQMESYVLFGRKVQAYNKKNGTDIKPWDCIRIISNPEYKFTSHPDIAAFLPEQLLIAIDILEHKPVFEGDIIYSKSGSMLNWNDPSHRIQLHVCPYVWTWTEPELAFTEETACLNTL